MEDFLSKTAGAILVVGAVLMLTGASIPFLSVIGGEAWQGAPDEVLAAVAKGPAAWRWANGLIAGAAVVTATGLTGLYVGSSSGRLAALAGLIAFSVGATLDVTARIINMTITPWATGSDANSATIDVFFGFKEFSEGLIRGFIFVGLVSLILLGVAGIQQEASWLGTLLIVFGVAGLMMELVGAAIPAVIYLGTGAIGLWLITSPLPNS